ncbi:hypothetical protein EPI10_013718 [Gossypium australe]|uniref:Uncharacterized protein n=1 Tax=Gossypium australe TaxID=47621 RepID=A0A5B6UMV4_9ROSI|nr:hypothetical protein EPI10_013718 [Gossypium australe]
MQNADSKHWHIAMKAEMDSIYSNSVWELVVLPKWIKHIRNLLSYFHAQVNLHIAIHCDGSRLLDLVNGCQDRIFEGLY